MVAGFARRSAPFPTASPWSTRRAFVDNSSQYEHWKRDRDGYMEWLEEKIATAKAEKGDVGRSHGFHQWGAYEEQIAMTGVGE